MRAELVAWLYVVAGRRARASGIRSADDCREVVQDAMPRILRALDRCRARGETVRNPAAVLERVIARSVAAAAYRFRMAGLGGVQPNGRHWHRRFPHTVTGAEAERIIANSTRTVDRPGPEVEDKAAQLARWVDAYLGVSLTADGLDAVVYVLDRLVAGVSRTTLIRGTGCLGGDPAMRVLGFDPHAAATFGCWLLGRADPGHDSPSVLDAFLDGYAPPADIRRRWRRTALDTGFARDRADADVRRLPLRPSATARRIA